MKRILITCVSGERVAEIEGSAGDSGAIDVLVNSPWRFVVNRNRYYNVEASDESWYCRWNGERYLGVPKVVCKHKCSMCRHLYEYGIEVLVYGRDFRECVGLFNAVAKRIVVRAA